ncbi:MAG: hypothetical protein HQ526_08010 [Actinobacteria bacterium]|nr:hypothetical protein [Actinomycetota bacterium]
MAAQTTFIFDGQRFALEACSINASLPDPYWCDKYNKGKGKYLRWSIEFSAEEKEIDDDFLAPSI